MSSMDETDETVDLTLGNGVTVHWRVPSPDPMKPFDGDRVTLEGYGPTMTGTLRADPDKLGWFIIDLDA